MPKNIQKRESMHQDETLQVYSSSQIYTIPESYLVVAEAISAIGREEVLEAKMVLAGAIPSYSLNKYFLNII